MPKGKYISIKDLPDRKWYVENGNCKNWLHLFQIDIDNPENNKNAECQKCGLKLFNFLKVLKK